MAFPLKPVTLQRRVTIGNHAMQINWATAKDTPDLAQVFYAAVREGPSPYTQAQRAAWMPQQPAPDRFAQRLAIQQVAVAKVSGMPVGFMTVTDAGYIDLAYILHAHRGAGVFRALYAQIEDAARQMSMARLSTHASLMAQPAFQAVGFCVIHHETVERAGVHLPRAKMEKTSDMTPEEIAKLPYRPCVGVMLINAQDEVFVGQRLDSKTQAWQMPQGGVEKREEPRAAALRELWEETGVDPALVTVLAESAQWLPYELPFDLVPKLWKGRYRGQEQKWFLMRFNGSDADINIATEHPEFSHWRWLAPAELVANIVPFKRDVYVAVLDEFRAHL